MLFDPWPYGLTAYHLPIALSPINRLRQKQHLKERLYRLGLPTRGISYVM